jgi:hypothetical protein
MIASMTSSLNIEQPLTSGIPDALSMLRPASEADYRKIEPEIRRQRAAWVGHLRVARREMKLVLERAGLRELRGGERGASVNGGSRPPESYLLLSRLKSSEAIRKMARFGEELCCMLDIWGIRLVVPDIDSLDGVAPLVQTHWADVPERQLMLRGGQMRFLPVGDYRTKEHLGRSGATSFDYDEAVHVNRRARLASRDPALLEEFSSPAIVDPLESLLGPDIDLIRNRHNRATVAVEPTYRSRLHRDILQRGWTNTTSTLTSCQWVPVPASAGDILLLDGLVFHAGGLGSDKNPRRVVTLTYTSVDELLQDEGLRSRVLVGGRRLSRGGSYS